MCVIAVCVETPLSEEQIEKMYAANSHGVGVAWREKEKKTGEAWVRWIKGIDTLDASKELIATLPLPYIAHFRVASVGPVRSQLCHPFPIDDRTTLALEGRTQGSVLFHNGTLGKWRDLMYEVALKGGHKIPNGIWNDSRAMAWMAGCLGIGVLEFFDQRLIAFGPGDLDVFAPERGQGWEAVEKGQWASNLLWKYRKPVKGYFGGNIHDDDPMPAKPLQLPEKTASSQSTTDAAKRQGESEVSPDQNPFHQSAKTVCYDRTGKEGAEKRAVSVRQTTQQGTQEIATGFAPESPLGMLEWVRKLNPKRRKGR